MNTAINSITVTSILSVVLHGVAVVGILVLLGPTTPDNAVGSGIEIELVSSVRVSNQKEVDVSRKQQIVAQADDKKIITEKSIIEKSIIEKQDKKKKIGNMPVLVSLPTVKDAVVRRAAVRNPVVQNDDGEQHEQKQHEQKQHEQKQHRRTIFEAISKEDSITTVAQSTAVSQQQHSILELLHSRIADNKRYPYLAKRQRREGVTTVAFVLHPSGMIEDMHLINSSQTNALDRAALSAVKGISPFIPAQDYLKQAETFKVDVVFKLL
ncbi:MAG: energy transducer TonB [Methylococcales bacterium]